MYKMLMDEGSTTSHDVLQHAGGVKMFRERDLLTPALLDRSFPGGRHVLRVQRCVQGGGVGGGAAARQSSGRLIIECR